MLKNILFKILAAFAILTSSLCAQNVDSFSVFYETDSFNLSAEQHLKLNGFLNKLDNVNIEKVNIIAFCDDKGTSKHNALLSLKRANTLKSVFLELNFKTSSTQTASGKGELPLLDLSKKNTEEQRAFNRRAEITVAYKTLEIPKEIEKESISKTDNLIENSKVGDKITLENILFVGSRSILLPESFSALENLTEIMKKNEDLEILILGHICCMNRGKDGQDAETGLYNLSVVRAQTVYDYLIENGIDSKRLSYKGLRSNFPTGKEDKYDRRVEIKIIRK